MISICFQESSPPDSCARHPVGVDTLRGKPHPNHVSPSTAEVRALIWTFHSGNQRGLPAAAAETTDLKPIW